MNISEMLEVANEWDVPTQFDFLIVLYKILGYEINAVIIHRTDIIKYSDCDGTLHEVGDTIYNELYCGSKALLHAKEDHSDCHATRYECYKKMADPEEDDREFLPELVLEVYVTGEKEVMRF